MLVDVITGIFVLKQESGLTGATSLTLVSHVKRTGAGTFNSLSGVKNAVLVPPTVHSGGSRRLFLQYRAKTICQEIVLFGIGAW